VTVVTRVNDDRKPASLAVMVGRHAARKRSDQRDEQGGLKP
jgi:hypothetical protein